jgi:hypothetical protein
MVGLALVCSAAESPAFRGLASEVQATDERAFQWMLDGGLGPLLHYASREGFEVLAKTRRESSTSTAVRSSAP